MSLRCKLGLHKWEPEGVTFDDEAKAVWNHYICVRCERGKAVCSDA